MTCREASKKLGVGIDWVRKMVWNGQLKATKTVNGWNVDDTDVARRVADPRTRRNTRKRRKVVEAA